MIASMARVPAVLMFVVLCLPALAHELPATAARLRASAAEFTARLDSARRAQLVLPFDDAARTDWHYTPRSRPGVSLAQLTPVEREALHAMLQVALSQAGHQRVRDIIELERVLKAIEFALSFLRDPEKYSLVLFGDPDPVKPWGWRFEGHHVSLSFTIVGNHIAASPTFFGANPARVASGPKAGLRALAAEEDEARKLLGMLDAGQRAKAVIDARSYGEIVTRASATVSPIDGRGLRASEMTQAQRAQLRRLLTIYAGTLEPGLRDRRLVRSEEGDFGTVLFAWAGPTEPGKPHYYRIQGARFLVEYDSSQDGGNHVHTVWRDFDGDFGRDLLREHYGKK